MRQAFHIFRKDVAHLWPHVAIVVLLAAAFVFSNRDPRQEGALTRELLGVLVPAAYAWLTVTLVHQEALPGQRQFWLTRPYRLGSLLAAKTLFLILFVCGTMLAKDILIARGFGYQARAYVSALLLRTLAWTSWVVLPALATGVVTRNLQEVGLVGGALALLYGLAGIFVPRSFWPGIEWVRDYLGILLLLALCAGIVLWQYFRRDTGKAWAAVAFCSAAIIIGLPLLPWGLGFTLQMLARRPRADLKSIQIMPGLTPQMAQAPRRTPSGEPPRDPVVIALPLKISGVPGGATLTADSVRAVFTSGQRDLWRSGWQQSWTGGNIKVAKSQVFSMDRRAYSELQNAVVTINLSLALTLLEPGPASRAPVRQRAFTILGERCENQSRTNDPLLLSCLAVLKAPPPAMVGLAAAGASQTVARSGVWSYAPYEALLDLSPVRREALPIGGLSDSCGEIRKLWESPEAQFVFVPQKPLAHFRRELQFHDVRPSDYVLPPSTAVFSIAQPCVR